MSRCRSRRILFAAVQLAVVTAFAGAWAGLGPRAQNEFRSVLGLRRIPGTRPVARAEPLAVEPLYDDPQLVGDSELASVLKRLRPGFPREELRPNVAEHALRTWGAAIEFDDPAVLDGPELRDFLLDHAQFAAAWGDGVPPLLSGGPYGVSVRVDGSRSGSFHHDHALACLAEAGVSPDRRVVLPSGRRATVGDMLRQALLEFRLDGREIEWSAMAAGLWLPPTQSWTTAEGRRISFDMLAERLMRGHARFGVCSGTHRVYSLVLLLRLDEEFEVLSPSVRDGVEACLRMIRDALADSQFEDGSWPSNWADGADAVQNPIREPVYKRIIATGHHLEWLALAPREFHPAREQIRRAARWLIRQTLEAPEERLHRQYTFYSHVGSALALWRGTRPAEFWREARPSDGSPTARGPKGRR